MIRALLIDLRDLLQRKGKEMVTDLKNEVPVAEGTARESIKEQVTMNGPVVTLTIEAADHFKWIEKGRKKGKMPPLSKIKRWCEVKGINVKYAFPIAKAIGERGIKPKHILKGVISKRQAGIEGQVKAMFKEKVGIEAKNLVEELFKQKAA